MELESALGRSCRFDRGGFGLIVELRPAKSAASGDGGDGNNEFEPYAIAQQ